MAIALGLIITVMLLKYRPVYVVTVSGKELGYAKNGTEFNNKIETEVLGMEGKNIDVVSLKEMPSYDLRLVDRTQETNEDEIILALKDEVQVVYKYYAVVLNNETVDFVDNIEEAEQAVNIIKEEHKNDTIAIDLQIVENYTDNMENVNFETIQVAQEHVEQKVDTLIKEEERNKLPSINGITLAVTPVQGRITSRFGVSSRIRSGAHTGTDIACPIGTPIKAVAGGTVSFAQRNGSYGNLLKIDHGNGVETWYAHCNRLIAKVGEKVNEGDIIAEVGSTGNSTGPHLHLEIRLNGVATNPQQYLYK